MYTLYKFHFLNGISEINQLFDDILIIWPASVCMYVCMYVYIYIYAAGWQVCITHRNPVQSTDHLPQLKKNMF